MEAVFPRIFRKSKKGAKQLVHFLAKTSILACRLSRFSSPLLNQTTGQKPPFCPKSNQIVWHTFLI